jgi:phosphoglycolate phosphatase
MAEDSKKDQLSIAAAISAARNAAPLESDRMTGKKKSRSDKIYFESILFDLDGTLIDSALDISLTANHVREKMGLPPLSLEKIKSFIGDGIRLLIARVLETEDPAILDKGLSIWKPYYTAHCLDNTVLFPGVEQVLAELHSDGVRMAVVSNKMVVFCEQILEGLRVKKYFSAIIGGDSTNERKPHPEPILFAARKLGITSKSVLVVGDNSHDIVAGHSAGYKSCGVLWGIGLEKSIRDATPDYVIHMPSDIPRLIRTIVSL